MQVAIAAYGTRISAILETADRILLGSTDSDARLREYPMKQMGPGQWLEQLKQLNVDVLICGAVSNQWIDFLQDSGIQVIPWMRGETADVWNSFRTGNVDNSRFTLPGRRRRQRRRGRQSGPRRYY